MHRLMLLIVSVLVVMSIVVSPAFAYDRDGDGWDEDWGFWTWAPAWWWDNDWNGWDGVGLSSGQSTGDTGDVNLSVNVS